MVDKEKDKLLENLPACAAEYIKLVIKKMRYRKRVRAEVMSELAAHFEDELHDCKTSEEKEKKAQQLIENFGDPKLLAILMRRAKKRCRPLWQTIVARSFQAAGILILCLILYTGWFFSGKPSVTVNYVAQLNQMVRPAADESLNAAPLYDKAAEQYHKKLQDCNEVEKLQGKKFYTLTSEQKQTIEKWLTDNKENLDLVATASQKPYYWQTYESKNGEMMPVILSSSFKFHRMAYALCWQAQLNAEKGEFQNAFDNIKTFYRFGRHLKAGNATPLVEKFTGIRFEALAVDTVRDILSHYQIDSAILAYFQKDFEQIIANDDFTIDLESEKLFLYDTVQRCFTDDRIGGGHLYLKRIFGASEPGKSNYRTRKFFEILLNEDPLHLLFTHPNKQQTIETADRYYAFLEKISQKLPAQLKTEGISIDEEELKVIKGNLLLKILVPAVRGTIHLSYRNKIDVESTLPLIAVLRYKQDFGTSPENLDKLVETGYLKKIPIDPFSDKPLAYKKTDDSFVIYSFGSDCRDDGGQPDRFENGKIKPWSDKGDWIF